MQTKTRLRDAHAQRRFRVARPLVVTHARVDGPSMGLHTHTHCSVAPALPLGHADVVGGGGHVDAGDGLERHGRGVRHRQRERLQDTREEEEQLHLGQILSEAVPWTCNNRKASLVFPFPSRQCQIFLCFPFWSLPEWSKLCFWSCHWRDLARSFCRCARCPSCQISSVGQSKLP